MRRGASRELWPEPFAGAIYLGLRMLFDRSPAHTDVAAFPVENGWAIYRAGMLTNVLNPKVALFFMAFLPQFVAPTASRRLREHRASGRAPGRQQVSWRT